MRVGARAVGAIAIALSALSGGHAARAQLIVPTATQPSVSDPSLSMSRLEERALEELDDKVRSRFTRKFELAAEERAALGSLDGTWEGTLDVIAATPSTPQRFWHSGDRPQLQLVVVGGKAEVRVKAEDW